jgi:acetyltransferase-like isoleucine patch superfamily enzyme
MNKLRSFIYFKKNAFLQKYRAIKNHYFFKRMDIQIGRNVRIIHGNGNHSFGKNFFVLDNSVFEVHVSDARIKTGDNCFLSFGVVVSCTSNLAIMFG